MDRRQKKTRQAIFNAFSEILSKKSYEKITVREIINAADIGRTTFYAHFETKEELLKELLKELFEHIIDSALGKAHTHCKFCCESEEQSVFLHLFNHIGENYLNIMRFLSSENNLIFLDYFKECLKELIGTKYKDELENTAFPKEFLINHISSSFVESASWWIREKKQISSEEITTLFLKTIEPLLKG